MRKVFCKIFGGSWVEGMDEIHYWVPGFIYRVIYGCKWSINRRVILIWCNIQIWYYKFIKR